MRSTRLATLTAITTPLALSLALLATPAQAQSSCGAAMADFQAALKANTAEALGAYLDQHAPCFEAPARTRLDALGGPAPAVAPERPAEPEVTAAPPPDPQPDPAPSSCEVLADARSEKWDEPVPIRVTNGTDETLSVAWIDYDGVRSPAGTLAPGEVFSGQTFVTHPFEFTDANGACVEIVMPESGVEAYEIGG